MLASNLGNSSIVHQLIASGSNVNHVDRMGTTALHYVSILPLVLHHTPCIL